MRVNLSPLPGFKSSRPARQKAPASAAHKFAVGQAVRWALPPVSIALSTETYQVVRLLPKHANDPQYRVKADSEKYERVARESHLQAVLPVPPSEEWIGERNPPPPAQPDL